GHQAASGLRKEIVATEVGPLRLGSEAGDGAIHKPWVARRGRAVVEAVLRHVSRDQVLDQHGSAADELQREPAIPTVLEIEYHRALVAVHGPIVSALASMPRRPPPTGCVTLGRLDLHDRGA